MMRLTVACDPGYYLSASSELDTPGAWAGKLSHSLGLSGVDPDAFRQLTSNRTPQGQKFTRIDQADRNPLYDLCFAEPKSVSIMEQIAGDSRISQARAESVRHVMEAVVEPLASAKIWQPLLRKQFTLTTGNLAWMTFDHKLSRPVNGIPDPNGHIHVTVMNGTEWKGKRYALALTPIREHAALIQAAWHADFAERLKGMGYDIRATKDAFEIAGVSDAVIKKFSRRSELIELEAKRREIKAPKAKAALGALTREKKRPVDPDKLHAEWMGRLSPAEAKALSEAHRKAVDAIPAPEATHPARHLEKAAETLLARESAVPETRLLTEALKKGIGAVRLPQLREAMEGSKLLRAEVGGVRYIASAESMRMEEQVLDAARNGRLTLQRVRRGEQGQGLFNPDLRTLHQAVSQSPNARVEAWAFHRLYSKPERGNILNALEDFAGVKTGQQRPLPKIVEKVVQTGQAVKRHIRRRLDRLRRHEFVLSFQQEPQHERPKQVSRSGWER